MSKVLTRDEILASRKTLAIAEVDVPEWGGSVFVREVTASERDQYEQSLLSVSGSGTNLKFRPNLSNTKAQMAVRCIVDEQGTRLFKDSELDIVGSLSARALERICDTAEQLSGMSKESKEEAEELFDAGQSEGSISD